MTRSGDTHSTSSKQDGQVYCVSSSLIPMSLMVAVCKDWRKDEDVMLSEVAIAIAERIRTCMDMILSDSMTKDFTLKRVTEQRSMKPLSGE